MKHIYLVMGMYLFGGILLGHSLEGIWEDNSCEPYGDGSAFGTYNFLFQDTDKIETFIKFYNNSFCDVHIGHSLTQAEGSYEIIRENDIIDGVNYLLMVRYDHLSHPLFFTAEVKNNEMQLCGDGRCSNYQRR